MILATIASFGIESSTYLAFVFADTNGKYKMGEDGDEAIN